MTTETESGSQEGSTKVKVYELAKELGTDSFGLLDKIKALGIGVKSHMSELEDADVQRVRDHLNPPAPVKAPKATKTTTRTPKATTTKIATAAKTTTTKATTTKRKTATTATPATTSAAVPAAATVIRRRTKSTGEVETVTTTDGISHKETIPAPGSPEALAAEADAQAAAAAEAEQQVEEPPSFRAEGHLRVAE